MTLGCVPASLLLLDASLRLLEADFGVVAASPSPRLRSISLITSSSRKAPGTNPPADEPAHLLVLGFST
eukprot:CAMPEP_0184292802 /NCGR_PEP_ID=MMETSP1049-20130417/4492_1 /TAXON_ID=77928 /ORGANISM="Proteomonas sulcata, Strain CCMP704" /LENGTH=68 /DNA_ID=CAMNT_0026600689 /DNA_START=178 /DNA_END=384 /DNA_ORIENTATION=+